MTFDSELYDGRALLQAAQDYAVLARIDVLETDGGYVCHFSDCRYDSQRTKLEFANYALELTVQRACIC